MSHQDSEYVHPLMRKPIGDAQSAPELLEMWTQEMAEDVPEAAKLEGVLYRVPTFLDEDLLLLCFDIADGYRMWERNFSLSGKVEDGSSRSPSPSTLRLRVVRKAFWALCEGMFKDRRKRGDFLSPSWANFVMQERIFKKILWFIFDDDRGRRDQHYTNLPHRPTDRDSLLHQERIFHKFVVDLVKFAWNFRGLDERHETEEDTRAAKMFRQARPDLIRILYKVGKLDVLEGLAPVSSDIGWGQKGLCVIERHTLRELAIGSLASGNAKDVWEKIERAVAEGNEAAEFLWCYLPRVKRLHRKLSVKRKEAREREKERTQQTREDLERKRTEAEAQLAALSEK